MPDAEHQAPRQEINPAERDAADRSAAGVPGAELPVVTMGDSQGVVLAGRLTPQLWVWPVLLLIPILLIMLVNVLTGVLLLGAQVLIMGIMRALENPEGRWVPAMRGRVFDAVMYIATGSMILALGILIPSLHH